MRRVLLLPLLLVTCAAQAQEPFPASAAGESATATDVASVTPEALSEFFDTVVPEQLRRTRIPGAVVIVVKDGAVVFSKGYGLADVASQRPMTPDTPVQLASISKTFTALAAMQLVEAGKLGLDTDVTSYVDFAIPGDPVTLRTLLSHEAAFESRAGAIGALTGPRAPLGAFLASFQPPRLDQPDGIPAYSNFHAALAALLVETASGEPLEDYWAEHIFRPLGMERTTARQPLPDALVAEVASGYIDIDLPPDAISMALATIYEAGATAIVAPATDVGRFLIAMLADDPRIVSRTTLDTMLRPQAELPGAFFGLGVYSPVADAGNPFIGHDGNTGGYQSTLALLREQRLGVFASYNGATPARGQLLRLFAERFLGQQNVRGTTTGIVPSEIASTGFVPTKVASYRASRRVDSNLFALPQLFGQLRIQPLPDGRLRLRLASIPLGGLMFEDQGSGRFRSGDREVVFGGEDAGVMQFGGAPATFLRVPWWMDASLVIPGLALCCFVAIAAVLAWPFRVRRHARLRSFEAFRATKTTRLALLLELIALAGAWWLVTAGRSSIAISDPMTIPIVIATYAAAWSGVSFAALAIWRYAQYAAMSPRRVSILTLEGVLVVAAVLLAVFSLQWRIAGTTLAL